VTDKSVSDALALFEKTVFSDNEQQIAEQVIKEILSRLKLFAGRWIELS
jgi:excinuclease UvrABC ATPase subunit